MSATEELKELGTLVVVVGKARNLVNKSRFGKQDPFCTVQLNEDKQKTKPIKRGGQHPEWDEELRFTIMEDLDDVLARSESTVNSLASSTNSVNSLSNVDGPGVTTAQALATKSRKGPMKKGGKSFRVACFADDAKEPELIGECVVPIDAVLKQGEVDEWYELLYKEKYSGEIYLELTFYSNDAPPVKRNVPRPAINPPYGGVSGYGPPASVSHHRLSNSISTSGSVSGMSLYIPPYVKPPLNGTPAASVPILPPSHSSFANLGLPPGHERQATPVPPAHGGYPPANTMSSDFSIDSLTRPLSSMSIGSSSLRPLPPPTPNPQQPPPSNAQPQGHGWGHRHSVGGPSEAPWGNLLPQSQPPPAPTPHPRPMSTSDAVPWNQQQRIEDERRMGGATPVPRPGTGQADYYNSHNPTDVYRQPSPIPPSLTPGGPPPPPAKHHAHSFSGSGPPPAQSYNQLAPIPDPIPHPSSAPPTSPHTGYHGVPLSSFAGIAQSLAQPSSPALPQHPYQPSPSVYQSTPPHQDYYPGSTYGTPTRQIPHRHSLPDPGAHQSASLPTPSRDNGWQQPQQSQYAPQGHVGYAHQPPASSSTPAPTEPGGYVPWYQQTSAPPPPSHPDPYPSSSSYSSPPPPVPTRRPIPNPPGPPKSSVGYYPSDELYAQQQLQQPLHHQSPLPWQASQTPDYQPPYQPSHQPYGNPAPQQYDRGRTPSPAPPAHTNAMGYPLPQQIYDRAPSPVPPNYQPPVGQGHYQRNSMNNQPAYGRSPSPQPPPPQNQYNNQTQSSEYPHPPRSPSPLPPPQTHTPAQLYPPSGSAPTQNGSRSPSPSTAKQDWRSYMAGLSVSQQQQQQQQQQQSGPIRSSSPQPPPKEWYTPPPSLPSSIRPPEGWQSTLPADSPGHQWRS